MFYEVSDPIFRVPLVARTDVEPDSIARERAPGTVSVTRRAARKEDSSNLGSVMRLLDTPGIEKRRGGGFMTRPAPAMLYSANGWYGVPQVGQAGVSEGSVQDRLAAQFDFAFLVDADDLHLDDIPSLRTSSTRATRFTSSSEMCTRPSRFGRISMKAPKLTIRRTVPS